MEPPRATSYKFAESPLQPRSSDMRYSHNDTGQRNPSSPLKRAPSAPVFSRPHGQNHSRKTTSPNPTVYTSSPSVTGSPPSHSLIETGRPVVETRDQQTIQAVGSEPLKPYIECSKPPRYRNSLRRGPTQKRSNTTSNSRHVRHSASFTIGDKMNEKNTHAHATQIKNTKQNSDESKETKIAMVKKKSGFSGFISTTFGVGTTKNFKISAPENPVHVTHVGYDNQTGKFTGLPKEWQRMITNSGITKREQDENPQVVAAIVGFYQESTENGGYEVWDKFENLKTSADPRTIPLCQSGSFSPGNGSPLNLASLSGTASPGKPAISK